MIEVQAQSRGDMLRDLEARRVAAITDLRAVQEKVREAHQVPGASVPPHLREAFDLASRAEQRAQNARLLCRDGWTYLSEGAGLVKIGSSKDVKKRLKALRIGSPVPLRLLGTVLGGRSVEVDLHARFAHKRVHGEWFDLTEEEIQSILAG